MRNLQGGGDRDVFCLLWSDEAENAGDCFWTGDGCFLCGLLCDGMCAGLSAGSEDFSAACMIHD